jgi:hypothetical protein
MTQTRLTSLIEAAINTGIGLVVSYLTWPVAATLFGVSYTTSQHINITLFFTVISVARSYIVRRYFNARLHRLARRAADRIEHRN